jgi:hypothetical protein
MGYCSVMQPDIALFADGETSFGGLKSLLQLEQPLIDNSFSMENGSY